MISSHSITGFVSSLSLLLACANGEKDHTDMRVITYNIATAENTYRLGFLCKGSEVGGRDCPSLNRLVYVGRGIPGSLSSAADSTLVTDLQYCPPYSTPHFDCYDGLDHGIRFNAWQLYINSSGFDFGYRQNLKTVKATRE